MEIREADIGNLEHWANLRHALWCQDQIASLRTEAERILTSPDQTAFLLLGLSAEVVGFAEVTIYYGASGPYTREITSHAGSEGSYAHLEGWYVAPQFRGQGLGQKLISSVEQWCRLRNVGVLTSDTSPSYPSSPNAHKRAGFKKIHEFTIFMKELN